MYHSVTFGNKNTWTDWKLVPTSRPFIVPPEPKIKTVDIPGGDGVIDLSETLTGYPVYNRRSGSIEFIVVNDVFEPVTTYKSWIDTYTEIMNYLHGRQMEMCLEDDPDYWYEGRFKVDSWASDSNYSKITIGYDLEPYKWKYNALNNLKTFTAYTSQNSYEFNRNVDHLGEAPSTPTFITSSTNGIEIRFVNRTLGIDVTQIVRDGTTSVPRFIFYGPSATMYYKSVSGSANFQVRYKEGSL